jgi:hypothetical protein
VGDVASIASLCIKADDVDDGRGIDFSAKSLRNPKNPNLEHTHRHSQPVTTATSLPRDQKLPKTVIIPLP